MVVVSSHVLESLQAVVEFRFVYKVEQKAAYKTAGHNFPVTYVPDKSIRISFLHPAIEQGHREEVLGKDAKGSVLSNKDLLRVRNCLIRLQFAFVDHLFKLFVRHTGGVYKAVDVLGQWNL